MVADDDRADRADSCLLSSFLIQARVTHRKLDNERISCPKSKWFFSLIIMYILKLKKIGAKLKRGRKRKIHGPLVIE